MTSEDLEDCFEDAASCVQAAVTSGYELSTDDKLENIWALQTSLGR